LDDEFLLQTFDKNALLLKEAQPIQDEFPKLLLVPLKEGVFSQVEYFSGHMSRDQTAGTEPEKCLECSLLAVVPA